jgi:thiamine-monophosphate kinase
MTDVALGLGEEFDLIRQLRERWGKLAVGLGDDAAVLEPPRGDRIVVTTDSAVELVHFRRDWLSMAEIGYRAVTAALSDIAAMGAEPRGALIALALSPEGRDRLMELADGIGDAVRDAGTVIIGGNLSQGDPLAITTTVIGSAHTPLTRAGARPGDLLYVTGALGGPSAALRAFQAGKTPSAEMCARFAHPAARIAEARWLAARGATAAIDVSDGLIADAGHVAAAGGCTLEVRAERVPVFAGATEEDALIGGEEYELLIASRALLNETEFADRFGISLTPIGRVTEGTAAVKLTRNGKPVSLPAARGYDHFS